MGWLHGNSDRLQVYTCKHGHDINASSCPKCEQEEVQRKKRSDAAIRAASDLESGGNYLHRIPLKKVDFVNEVDDYMDGWISVQAFINACTEVGAIPGYDPRDSRVYPDIDHSMGFGWR